MGFFSSVVSSVKKGFSSAVKAVTPLASAYLGGGAVGAQVAALPAPSYTPAPAPAAPASASYAPASYGTAANQGTPSSGFSFSNPIVLIGIAVVGMLFVFLVMKRGR